MALIGNITIGVSANTGKLAVDCKKAAGLVGQLDGRLGKLASSAVSTGAAFTALGAGIAAAALVVKASIGQAMSLEKSMAGLAKATDLEGDGLAQMRSALQDLSVSLKGVPIEDLLAIATTGAKLGVATGELLEYTEGVAKLSTAMDDIPAEQIADQVGKINLVFGLGVRGAQQLGSAIDKLADSGASSAPDIMAVTQRISGSAAAMKLSAPAALSIAAALIDTGTESEAAAASINLMLQTMIKTENHKDFAKLAGMDVAKFSELVKTKPVEAIQAFLAALKKLDANDQIGFLAKVGIEGVRSAPNIQKLAQQVDFLGKYLGDAESEFRTLNQISQSYSKTAALTESSLIQFENNLKRVGATIGDVFLPPINAALGALNKLTTSLSKMLEAGGDRAKWGVLLGGFGALGSVLGGSGGAELMGNRPGLGPKGAPAAASASSAARASAVKAAAASGGGYDVAAESKADKLKEKIDSLTKSLSEEVQTFGMAAHAADAYRLGLEGATEAQLAQANALAKQLDTLEAKEKIDSLTKSLKEQIAVMGMSADEAEIYRLKLKGVSEGELMYASALAKDKTAKEQAKDLYEETRTPLEKYQSELKKLSDLLSIGAIDQDTAARKAAMLGKDLQDSVEKPKDTEPAKHAAAVELGSAEAYSAIARNQGGRTGGDKIEDVAKNTKDGVNIQNQMLVLMRKLVPPAGVVNPPQLAVANF